MRHVDDLRRPSSYERHQQLKDDLTVIGTLAAVVLFTCLACMFVGWMREDYKNEAEFKKIEREQLGL